jgi:hypothetical protein
VTVGFGKRRCFTGAMVLGNEPLLGAIPMEDMDLVVLPGTRTVAVKSGQPEFCNLCREGNPGRLARVEGRTPAATIACEGA